MGASLRHSPSLYESIGEYTPGTQIIDRLKNDDPPRTETDKISQAHDIRYSFANSWKDIRDADHKMIAKTKEARDKGLDSSININVALRGIQGKILGERVGIIKRGIFESFKIPNPADRALLDKKLKELEKEGYGVPGYRIRKMMLAQVNKNKVRRTPRKVASFMVDNYMPRVFERMVGNDTKYSKRRLIRSLRPMRREIYERLKKRGGIAASTVLALTAILAPIILPKVFEWSEKGISAIAKKIKHGKKKGRGIKETLKNRTFIKMMIRLLSDKSLVNDKVFMDRMMTSIYNPI